MQSRIHREPRALYRYRFGSADFDEARFELRVAGVPVEAQRKPLEVLRLLVRRAGEVVTKEEFLEDVWNGRETVENVVGNALAKLRAALGGENATLIVTQARIGYRLVGPVERTAVGRQLASVLEFRPGQPIPQRPHFELERLLGVSHGSEVWLARHAKTMERRVYKFSRDGEQLVALKRECSLYRVLQEGLGTRTDFVRILDWNFEVAPFFLECEYGGEDLAQWAESDGHLAQLALDHRLALFRDIVDAVAAAHRIGVLHKDLKPANILVKPDGEAWHVRIADFGSARLLEPERLKALDLTLTKSLETDTPSGTHRYVAPEVLAGNPSTVQSDVYSLGLILYQLLVGDLRKPLAPGWERDVPDELLREDIAAATDGDPTLRPASAEELAQRLRRLPERRAERVRAAAAQDEARAAALLLQRNRARRPWVIAALSFLALGLTASLGFYWRATIERTHAEREAAQAQAINRFLNEDLLGAADPTAPGSVSNPTVREVLARASDRLGAQPGLEGAIKASLYATLGNSYAGLNDLPGAELNLRRAIAASSGDGARELRARTKYSLVNVLLNTTKKDQAQAVLDEADRDAAPYLKDATALALLAHLTRGYVYDSQSLEDRALEEFEIADRLRLQVSPADPIALFKVRLELVSGYIAARRFSDADRIVSSLLAPEYTIERVGVVNWAKAREDEGELLSNDHHYEVAAKTDLDAIQALRQRLGAAHFYVGIALSELANVFVDSGRLGAALPPAHETYDIMVRSVGENGQDALLARANLGVLESKLGRIDEGIPDMKASREGLLNLLGDSANPQIQVIDYYLASSLSEAGQQADAWSILARLNAASLAQSGDGGNDWEQRLEGTKGEILLREGHRAEAASLLQAAVERMQADHVHDWILEPFRASLERARREAR
jgi:serine/threonine protein kinase